MSARHIAYGTLLVVGRARRRPRLGHVGSGSSDSCLWSQSISQNVLSGFGRTSVLVDTYRQARRHSACPLRSIITRFNLVHESKDTCQDTGGHSCPSRSPYHHPGLSRRPENLLSGTLRRRIEASAEGCRSPQLTSDDIAPTRGTRPAEGAQAFGGEVYSRHGTWIMGSFGVVFSFRADASVVKISIAGDQARDIGRLDRS